MSYIWSSEKIGILAGREKEKKIHVIYFNSYGVVSLDLKITFDFFRMAIWQCTYIQEVLEAW